MSASDKKKQRKADLAGALTQKEQREQAEVQAAKRQKTIYTAIGGVCAVAAAALLVWNGLTGVNKNATAAVVDGVEYSVADMQYYYFNSYTRNYYYNMYSYYGAMVGYDGSKSDGAQWANEAEGQTYADLFREAALDSLKQTSALCKAADEAGYTLSEAGQKQIDERLRQIDIICAASGYTRSTYFSQMGCTEKVFLRNLTRDMLASEYLEKYAEGISYDDDALQAYYEENADAMDSFDYRVFTVDGSAPAKQDSEGKEIAATEEEKTAAMEEARTRAYAAMTEIQAADDMEKAFTEAAPKYVAESSKDAYTNSDLSLQKGVLGSKLSSTLAGWLTHAGRQNGDMTVIENASGNGYQVVLFLDRYLLQDPTVNIRHILIKPEIAEDAQTNSAGAQIPTQEAMDAAKAELEDIMAQWEHGDKTAESFGELANQYSDDGGSNTKGGLYTYVAQGQMVPNFDAWIYDPARQSGDTGYVENSGDDASYYGWHAIYFEGPEEPSWKNTAIQNKRNTDQSEWVDGLVENITAETAEGMEHVGPANTAVATATPTPDASAAPDATPTPESSTTPDATESPAA